MNALLAGGLTLVPVLALAQPPAPSSRNDAGETTVRAHRLTESLRLDGALTEPVYSRVPAIDSFIQSLPNIGGPPTERTEAWVFFDNDAIYVSARCWDSAPPSEWIANEMRRDSTRVGEQDGFSLMLDTFHDRRNGNIFHTSPLAVRSEAQITNETNANSDWEVVWDVRSARFEGGWSVEIVIPFTSLRYKAGQAQEWGIQLRRQIRRKNEWIYLTPIPVSASGRPGLMRISLAATLVGLDLPPATANVEIKPYASTRVVTDRTRTPPIERDADLDVGVDVKYGITANLTADFTYNTDFAQIEADEQQVNLTRFNLVFPEKRDFFLEGRGIFDFGRPSGGSTNAASDMPQLFYSRRIGLNAGAVIPIQAGGRITGKAGNFAIGLLNLQAVEHAPSQTPATNFTVVRLRRDVLRRSSVGMIVTNRSNAMAVAGSNQAYGVDGAFSFFEDVNVSGYWARTRTPGTSTDDVSYAARFDYAGDRYGVRVEDLLVGTNFNPEVGFLRRSDFRRLSGSGRFSPRPSSLDGAVRKYTWEANTEYFLNPAGNTESSKHTAHFDVELNSSDRLTTEVNRNFELLERPFGIAGGVTIPEGGYDFNDAAVSYAFGPQRRMSGTLTVEAGQFYDGNIAKASFTAARVSVNRHLSFEPSIAVNRVRLPAGDFTTRLYRTRTDYAFSTRMFATALVQFNSADRSFSSNLRFHWEYNPGSDFFVVYTDERDTAARGIPVLKNRAFALKITRLLMF